MDAPLWVIRGVAKSTLEYFWHPLKNAILFAVIVCALLFSALSLGQSATVELELNALTSEREMLSNELEQYHHDYRARSGSFAGANYRRQCSGRHTGNDRWEVRLPQNLSAADYLITLYAPPGGNPRFHVFSVSDLLAHDQPHIPAWLPTNIELKRGPG